MWITLHPGEDSVPPPQQQPLGDGSSLHFVQDLRVPLDGAAPGATPSVRWIRLLIARPSTQWGSSLWRVHVWGVPLESAPPAS